MFVKTLETLLKRNGLKKKEFLKEMGLNVNSFFYWKKRNNLPDGITLIAIADKFNVELDYLVGRSAKHQENYRTSPDNPAAHVYDKYGTQLLDSFHMLNEEGKARVVAYTADLLSSPKYTKCLADGPVDSKEQA
jgi:transcriptional regulator with XRE-family HTH domain